MSIPTSILEIEIRHQAEYRGDIGDPSLFATEPGPITGTAPNNFFVVTLIGDIRKVNGEEAHGAYVGRTRVIKASPTPPQPGGAVTDITRTAMREHIFEILNGAHRQIGTIVSTGFSGGQPPPGTGVPPDGKGGNWAIVGGTGAYLGARGQLRGMGQTGRPTTMVEDPGRRRINTPDNAVRFILRLIPMHAPEIMTTATGPLIFDHNHTLVTQLTPAIANHDVLVYATGLGPTHPDVDLDQTFPLTPHSVVDSPVAVTIGDVVVKDVRAIGIPGTIGSYRVGFKMPNVGVNALPIRLTSAWIDGPPSTIWAGV